MQNNVVVFFFRLFLSDLMSDHSFICTGEVISHHSFFLKLQSLHLLLEEDCRKPSCVKSEEVETVGLCMRWSCAFCVLYLLNVSALHY